MLSLRSPRPDRPLLIAHRGASGEAPENTMAAFRLALEQGADLLEMDVHLAADGSLVVLHDPTVDRTTDGHGLVGQLTLDQIKALDAGSWFSPQYEAERIPTLEDVLQWAAGRVALAIEIKRDGPIRYPGIEAAIVERLRRFDMVRSAAVISFDHAAVLRTKQLCPEVAGGVLFACSPVVPFSLALEARAEAILPHWANLSREMVSQAHARGLAVSTWVADDEPALRWILSLKVDAVATNYPARLLAMLKD